MSGETEAVRPGGLVGFLPGSVEILEAARLLRIPLAEQGVRLDGLPEERRVTVLLTLLSSWLGTYLVMQEKRDGLSVEEQGDLVAWAESLAASRAAAAKIDLAARRAWWVAHAVAGVTRGSRTTGNSPHKIVSLLVLASICLLDLWRDAHGPVDQIELDGITFAFAARARADKARELVGRALEELAVFVGVPEPGTDRDTGGTGG